MNRTVITIIALSLACATRARAQTPCPGERRPDIRPDYVVIQGDIVVRADYCQTEAAFSTNFWPGGLVPYVFDASVSAANQQHALNAMAEWEAVTAVDFRPRTNEANWIVFHASSENNSQVGMQGGSQTINIADWSNRFVVAHELAHALGYWHEQSRPDRGTFVSINYANICQNCCNGGPCDYNFDIVSSALTYGPYDFDSVMHYGQLAFSVNNQPTITVLAPNQQWQNLIGQRTHLSTWDARVMSFVYPEPNWRFVDRLDTGSLNAGTFLEPYTDLVIAAFLTPIGGKLWVTQPATYTLVPNTTFAQALTFDAPLGGVVFR